MKKIKEKLRFDFTGYYNRIKKMKKNLKIEGVEINLPFVTLVVDASNNEKKIAREIILRLRDKRVLNSKECCDNCIENALKSILDIRSFLVDKQVQIDEVDSPLFLLTDFALFGLRKFLTYTEHYKPIENMIEYFDALEIIRSHLLRVFDEISKIAELPNDFGFRYHHLLEWSEDVYFIEQPKQLN